MQFQSKMTKGNLGAAWAGLVLFVLLLLALGASMALGQEAVGELVLERGIVKMRREDQDFIFRDLEERLPVFTGDVLHSGSNTRAQVFFRDGRDVISLYSKTLFTIEDVSPKRSFFALSIGKALFRVFARLRQEKFSLRTPTATIGVKGTEFVAGTDGINTYVLTVSGVVSLANIDFPEREVLLSPNQASTVQPRTPPAPPVDVTPEEQATIVAGEGVEGFEDIPFDIPPAEDLSGEEPQASEEAAQAEAAAAVEDAQQAVAESTEEVKPSGDVGTIIAPVNISVTR